jgi:GNAT superfamily N-acetyltransferase
MAIFRRGAYGANCWVQGGEGEWLIEHVATLPAYRGRGLVQALIDHARGRKGRGICAGLDLVPDRQRGGGAMLRQGRLYLRRGEARSGVRGDHRLTRLPPLHARDLV